MNLYLTIGYHPRLKPVCALCVLCGEIITYTAKSAKNAKESNKWMLWISHEKYLKIKRKGGIDERFTVH